MFENKTRGTVSTVMVAVAVILLAGCDSGIESMAPALVSLLGSTYATSRDTVSDPRFMAQTLAIEHRHFEIYKAYRPLFDKAAGAPQTGGTGGVGNDAPGAAAGNDRAHTDTAMSCSMRALLVDN